MRAARERLPLVAAAAVAGAVAGHAITYLAAFPNAGARDILLGRTGHRYFSSAIAVAVVFGVVASGGTVLRHFTRGSRGEDSHGLHWWGRYRAAALRLVALQAAIFVVQEVAERLISGAPVASLLHGSFLLVGLAVQVLVAAAVALVLTGLGGAAEALGRRLGPASLPIRGSAPRFPLRRSAVTVQFSLGARVTRAPPAALGAPVQA